MTAPFCSPRASKRTQFGESMRSSKVSSMATIRSSSGMSAMSALSSVVLPAPGAAAHEDIPAGVQHPLGLVADVRGQRALCDQLRRRKGSVAKPPDGDGDGRAGRRDADGHARAVVQARIEDRRRGRVQAQGPGDMDRRPLQRRRVERGRGNRPEPAVAFEPHVPRPVDHDFAHVRIVERGLKARQEGFQQVQPVAGHSWPVRFACQ